MLTTTTVLIDVFGSTSATFGREQIDRDQADRAAVGELMHHFRGGVERIGVGHHQAGLQRAEHRDRIRQAIRHLDRDAIAGLEAGHLAQVDGELIGQPIGFFERDAALRSVRQPERERRLLRVGRRRIANRRRHVRIFQRPQIRRALPGG